jgi:site-specific DNA-methyltransferase (adenine-specific)
MRPRRIVLPVIVSDNSTNSVTVAAALPTVESLASHCVDVIYVDPPFCSNRRHNGTAALATHFNDRWEGGVEGYLTFLEPCLREMKRVLKPNGSLLLHLDWHVVHYAKVLCDSIFGIDAFQNELVWYYQTGGASKGRFSRKHDTILFYAAGPDFYFDGKAIAIPRTPKAMKRARSGKGARIAVTDTHKNPDDVLIVPALNPMSNERTGYPTQKPLELLEKLITALCPPNGTVADFFCGSGTTLVAAKRLGRHYIGCDPNPHAIEIARQRLADDAADQTRRR